MTAEPVQLDAEKALIGAVLSGYRELDELAVHVFPSSFRELRHEWIWSTILRVAEAGNRPDPVAVQVAMTREELAKLPNGALYLADLAQSCPHPAQAPYYAKVVAEQAARDRLAEAATRISDLPRQTGLPLDEMRARARAEIDAATEETAADHSLAQLVDVIPETLDIAQYGRQAALGTGWPDLDRIIRGIAPGRLIVVGARPGVGKSVMGTNLAAHVAGHHQHAVLLASMEMPRVEVAQRIVAAQAMVNLTDLETGACSDRDWERIARAKDALDAMPLTIDDRPAQTLATLRLASRDVRRRRGDLALIVVDYLQLMRPSDSRVSRVEQVGEMSRGLKLLARETNACVVAMAQVNRESVKSRDGRPRMSDLRESGAIEADADAVILLHQPDDDIPEIEVIVDKQRSGPKGVATLSMQGHYARLVSVTWTPSGEAS